MVLYQIVGKATTNTKSFCFHCLLKYEEITEQI